MSKKSEGPDILVSSVGLVGKKVYLAHENGNWGPETEGSDHLQNEFSLNRSGCDFILPPNVLVKGEEFKIVVPVADRAEAMRIYGDRMRVGAHVSERFDFDANENTLWLLAHNYPVVRPMEWNQNNVHLW